MKIKNDFITNSSSVSFVGWGIDISNDKILKEIVLRKLFDKYQESKYGDENLKFEDFQKDPGELIDFSDSKILEFSAGQYEDRLFIIGNPEKMRNDQTLAEFKEEIIEELRKFGISVTTLEFISESWYDG